MKGIMKINIPKVIVGVDMGEYAPELSGRMLQVWVNLPLDVLSEHLAMAARLNPAVINPHPALSLKGRGGRGQKLQTDSRITKRS